jgi:hypothetical protein
MSRYQVVTAAPDHIGVLALKLRQADRNEVWLAGAMTAQDALSMSMINADYARVWLVDGEPAAMGGVTYSHDDCALIWLMGTDLIRHHRREFLRASKRAVDEARRKYRVLYNWVSADNRAAIGWLKWLDFTVNAPAPFGLFHRPCCLF